MLKQLSDSLDSISSDALVITGEGKAFCAGLDLEDLNLRSPNIDLIEALAEVYLSIVRLRIPTCAIINGPAVGGGVGLSACFDLVKCCQNSSFFVPGGNLKEFAAIVFPVVKRKAPGFQPDKKYDAAAALKIGIADIPAPLSSDAMSVEAIGAKQKTVDFQQQILKRLLEADSIAVEFEEILLGIRSIE